ncbi:MAG: hypothetical protein RJB13_1134 [Pseudomonadota bacterium]
MEWPEVPIAALRREMIEELGWCTSGELVLKRTIVSENFPLIELIFEAVVRVSEHDCEKWVIQESEIDGFFWMTSDEVENHPGVLARHKSAVLDILRAE